MGVPSISNELNTQRHLRAFFQPGGAGPNNPRIYSGQDMAYMRIEGVSASELGGVDPVNIHDPNRPGAYKVVATTISAGDLAKANVVLSEKRGAGIPRQFLQKNCSFAAYEVVGNCKDLSDFNGGWSEYVAFYPGGIITDKDYGDRSTWEDDKPLETSLSAVFTRNPYAAGGLTFGTTGPATLTGKLQKDVAYGGGVQCGDCGDANDGTKWVYVAAKGATGAKPDVNYSTDGGKTWNTINLSVAAVDEDPLAIEVIGNKLVVMSATAGGTTLSGYYTLDINSNTGVPSNPVKISTGFVTSQTVAGMCVLSPSEIYFVGAAGYIYKATDITAGVSVNSAGAATNAALNRVDGNSEVVVAVGANGTVIKSYNHGASWSATSANPGSGSLQALAVVSRNVWFVGDASGALYYTTNGGDTWYTKNLPVTAAAINDILFVTPEVGYIAAATSTPAARLMFTLDGGYSWSTGAPRVSGLIQTATKFNRLAAPQTSDATIAANNLFIAGNASVATDGIIINGSAAIY